MEEMKTTNPFRQDLALFSIISPCYGQDWKHLETNYNTLKAQEYKEWEWLVIFDGQNQFGVKKMKELIARDPELRITYHVIVHAGACAARNYGATLAQGEYYSFLNADNFLYPEALRMWANAFENPKINRVWGLYDIKTAQGVKGTIGSAPLYPNGQVWYPAFKYQNYCDSSFPIRAAAYTPWRNLPALQDWDWAIRQLQRDNFKGEDWEYIPHSFFLAEDAEPGGLSEYSHTHWWELTRQIRHDNGIPDSDICVCSLGAPHHGFHIAEKLGADYLPMPSFKEHHYKMVYLIGFYTAEDANNPYVTKTHLDVFERNKGKNVIHWIGTDVLQLRYNCSWKKIQELKQIWRDKKVIHLTEFKPTYKEMAEVGIETKIIPIPPRKLYNILPLSSEFTVGIYESNRSPMYNKEFMDEIVRNMPDVKFLYFGEDENKGQKGDNYEHLGYVSNVIEKCSINLRITPHDGLPLLPIEFLMAGRGVITNVPLKGAITVKKDRKMVIEAIRRMRKMTLDPRVSKYWRKQMNFEKYKKRIRRLI
jgi:glycosyltransferase involved in cell wall biosynthesis